MSRKSNFGNTKALLSYMTKGNKITVLEAVLYFGVANVYSFVEQAKKKGYPIKKEQVTMARILRRVNDKLKCEAPDLPTKDIYMHEWWISK